MISASMIVKNEEAMLDGCLQSIQGIDEIVIVDTGSTDNTVEIARKYTDKVIAGEYKWNDNFAEARNYCLDRCAGDWVFIIDADERLITGVDKLKQSVESANGHDLLNLTVVGGSTQFWNPRLFKNNLGIRWVGAIHNHLNRSGGGRTDSVVEYGYSPSHRDDPERALRILRKEITRDPNLVREKYYLAREHWYRKEWVQAIVWFQEYLRVAYWGPEWADGWYLLADCLFRTKRYDEAKDACLQAIKINADFKQALGLMAKLCGPKNRKRWTKFSESAENNDVLFIRG